MTYAALRAQGITSVYLAGPMTGLKDHNHPAFNILAKSLRKIGFEVFNPAENFEGDVSRPLEAYMRINFSAIMEVHALVLLEQWELSVNARREVEMARALALPLFCARTLHPIHEEVTPGTYARQIVDEVMREGLKSHGPGVWKTESLPHHLGRAANHLAVGRMIIEGVKSPDKDNHLHNALARLSMALCNHERP